MKITYGFKETIWGKKISIDIIDFEGQQKELEKLLENFKVVRK